MADDMAPGGFIPGPPIPVVIESWECFINHDGMCIRTADGHDPDNAPIQGFERTWICTRRSNP